MDEVDQIRQPQVLYTLARYGFGLLMISNHSFINWDLDGRIKSSLILNEVEFKPYSKEELYDIINQRVSFALRPRRIEPHLIRAVSVMAEGDARVGLLMLKASAKNAEARSADNITLDDVKTSLKGARRLRVSYLLKLNEHQRVLYDIMKKRIRITSADLYKEYRRSTPKPLVDRAYRRHMQRMIQLGLVKEEGSGRWKRYEAVS
ncbi:putative orc1/cdc6 family replication initiation protein [Candidatus Nitrososphaera gargensis Ga9.2]|uniref:Putative orc1/cdc6 family replication initiation protein n=1 Tax=Nitrososphaera gargensis (strain Ga9.2) TaxID=1237085 RepID=K0IKY3_NITGG|nr:orc1/cdc6 family replication initiation protein [Candidatus Nitrososphaera gargensis]AFU60053.1 putative orc1/cdc6 family replication initiation protein [Candidatus Nitrososphaera gargensis Ga9.2]